MKEETFLIGRWQCHAPESHRWANRVAILLLAGLLAEMHLAGELVAQEVHSQANRRQQTVTRVVPLSSRAKNGIGTGTEKERRETPKTWYEQSNSKATDKNQELLPTDSLGIPQNTVLDVFIPKLAPGTTAEIDFNISGNLGCIAYLNAWIDWNDNGRWEVAEQIVLDHLFEPGNSTLRISVPLSAAPGFANAKISVQSQRHDPKQDLACSKGAKDYYILVNAKTRILANRSVQASQGIPESSRLLAGTLAANDD